MIYLKINFETTSSVSQVNVVIVVGHSTRRFLSTKTLPIIDYSFQKAMEKVLERKKNNFSALRRSQNKNISNFFKKFPLPCILVRKTAGRKIHKAIAQLFTQCLQ